MEKKMEEINIIKQNYLYRKDIHRLIGKRRDINDYILKNKTANYLIKNIFDDKPFETIVMEMAEMYGSSVYLRTSSIPIHQLCR